MMEQNKPIPTSLKVVAALFMFWGLCTAIEMIVSLVRGQIAFKLEVLYLFIGHGLLNFRRVARNWALFILWGAMIVFSLGASLVLLGANPTGGAFHFRLFDQVICEVSRAFAFTHLAVFFLLAVWQYRVLNRTEVSTLFEVHAS
jgi:hypothetical protein